MTLYDIFVEENIGRGKRVYPEGTFEDGIRVCFDEYASMEEFFLKAHRFMQQEKLVSKVIGKTMFIWRRVK